jgi:hypothetical membrane protein
LKLKLRFLAGGTIIFILGFILSAIRGLGIGYAILMTVGIVLLVVGLFWREKPPHQPDARGVTP